ncbi:Phage terminase, small subunit [Janthinobacterium sp. CG23_2]|nr:Phage terminase, small subunit [Janthinobacterium sp. CG23_2]CUI03887.1 Phage terminase, small subunit [Janthinobacterium sp. CG23_2]CUU26411.1 Phage terminase, small subunit [Janthinobacterium sp. CG23_2]CUU27673.1 Phage terminase, small subunit [Janthinobacterium sp. CG23_2]
MSEGESLRAICRDDEMPNKATVFRWLAANAAFSDQYARAREAQADCMADEIIEIADDGLNDTYEDDDGNKRTDQDVIARSRLRVDARKWLASKMAPKKYGDKITQEHTGSLRVVAATEYTDDQLAAIAAGSSG